MKHSIQIILLLVISGNLFSQSYPSLRFRKPTTSDNIVWKFTNVASGVDAFVTVIGSKNATLSSIDDSSKYAYAWNPFIKFTNAANATDTSYVEFNITFKFSNGKLDTLKKMAMTVIDLDGSGAGSYREMVSTTLPATPKGIIGSAITTTTNSTRLTAISGTTSFGVTDTNTTAGMLQINYSNINSFNFRVGVVGNTPANNTRQFSFYFKPFSSMITVLPVKLIDFKAVSNNEVPEVRWTTTSEVNANRFEVYRSLDGVNYTQVGNSVAKGNSQTMSYYTFADNDLFGKSFENVYYKLRMIDNDEAYTWSSVVHFGQSLNAAHTVIASVYPNPSKGNLNISFKSISENEVQVQVIDLYGKVYVNLNQNDINGQYDIALDLNDLSNGVYFVKVTENNGQSNTIKFIKN